GRGGGGRRGRDPRHEHEDYADQDGQAHDGQAVHPPPSRLRSRLPGHRPARRHRLAWKVASICWSSAGLEVYDNVTSTAERWRATTMVLVVSLDGSVSAGWPATVVGVGPSTTWARDWLSKGSIWTASVLPTAVAGQAGCGPT